MELSAYDILIERIRRRFRHDAGTLVFLAVAVLTFGLMAAVHARNSVKRRAAGIAEYAGDRELIDKHSLRSSSVKAVQRLLDYTNKHYSTAKAATSRSCAAG